MAAIFLQAIESTAQDCRRRRTGITRFELALADFWILAPTSGERHQFIDFL
jgi:hypothetical protein